MRSRPTRSAGWPAITVRWSSGARLQKTTWAGKACSGRRWPSACRTTERAHCPSLRHVILNDEKSSTYKLALLRVLCRIADAAAGLARHRDDDHVAVPMGLVALTWLRLFKPILEADLPQSPGQPIGVVMAAGLREGRVRAPRYRLSHHDLRVGMRFSGDVGKALHEAIRDAAAHHRENAGDLHDLPQRRADSARPERPHDPTSYRRRAARATSTSPASGRCTCPTHLWTALQRYSVWIEPALQAEWTRLTKRYADEAGATDRRWSIGSGDDVVRSRSRCQRCTPGGGTPARDGRSHVRVERQTPEGGSFRHRSLLPLGDLAVRRPVEPHARPPAGSTNTRNVAYCPGTESCVRRRIES